MEGYERRCSISHSENAGLERVKAVAHLRGGRGIGREFSRFVGRRRVD